VARTRRIAQWRIAVFVFAKNQLRIALEHRPDFRQVPMLCRRQEFTAMVPATRKNAAASQGDQNDRGTAGDGDTANQTTESLHTLDYYFDRRGTSTRKVPFRFKHPKGRMVILGSDNVCQFWSRFVMIEADAKPWNTLIIKSGMTCGDSCKV